MSAKSIEDLKKIATSLREKLNFLNKNIQNNRKEVDPKPQVNFQMNSDSERQALELFDSVKPKKDQIGLSTKAAQQSEIKDSNIRSILRQKIDRDVENQRMDKESEEEQVVIDYSQRQDKKSKSVSFNFDQNLIFTLNPDRKWNEKIQNQKKGKFQLYEQKALSDAIGQYIATNEISFNEFVKWLSVGGKEERNILRKEKFFKLLSSVLPNRSPQSCYKFVIRNFNSLNHQGNWSEEEVEKLKSLIEKYGRKWTLIGKELGRTSDNVYDKFRSMGEQGLQERVKSLWKIRQLVTLLLQIQRQTSIQFMDHNIKKELQREIEHDGIEQKQLKEHRYNSKLFTFHNIEVIRKYVNAKLFQGVQLDSLRWKKIVKEVKTKNMFDCRNKIVQILQVLFRNNESLDESLVAFLKREKATEQAKLNWKNWRSKQYTSEQAKNRLMIMKKLVEGRTTKPFQKVYEEVIAKISKMIEKDSKKK